MKNNFQIAFLFVLLITFGNIAFAQSQGPNSPAAATEQCYVALLCAGANWSYATRAEQSDTSYAFVKMLQYDSCTIYSGNCFYTHALITTDYQFTVPSNALITGIQVRVEKFGSIAGIKDTVVQLYDSNVAVGSNRALPGIWKTTDSTYIYGDSTDLWGYAWTPALINDSSFGVWFKSENMLPLTIDTAFVNWVGVTVYYSIPSDVNTINSADNLNIQFDAATDNLTLTTNLQNPLSNSTLTVYDLLGQTKFSKELPTIPKGKNKSQIKIPPLAAGIYLIELTNEKNHFVKKIEVGY